MSKFTRKTNYVPKMDNITHDDYHHRMSFTLSGIPVAFANGLRRCMIAHIPAVALAVSPEKKAKWTNTSRFHNEIVEERLQSIPIHTKDLQFLPDAWQLEVDVANDSEETLNITTAPEFFKLKNKESGKYMDENDVRKLFPPNAHTGRYILFLRLNAKVGNMPAPRISLVSDFVVTTGGRDSKAMSAFVGMGNTQDGQGAKEAWEKREREFVTAAEPLSPEEIETERVNFFACDAQRYYVNDSFDFKLESVGVYSCEEIIAMGTAALIEHIGDFSKSLEKGAVMIVPNVSTMENAWKISIGGDCYTVGKIIEWLLYVMYYLTTKEGGKFADEPVLTYCAFRKEHPHHDEAYLFLSFVESVEKEMVAEYLLMAVQEALLIISDMRDLVNVKRHV